jgi:phospholipid-translocating ATPase
MDLVFKWEISLENGKWEKMKASSPDEIALVEFAESLGVKIEARTQKEIEISLVSGRRLNYEILANFPFSSETKRMKVFASD